MMGTTPAFAGDGGAGRSIVNSGLVDGDASWSWSANHSSDQDSVGLAHTFPYVDLMALNLGRGVMFPVASNIPVWGFGRGRWSFASFIATPYLVQATPAGAGTSDAMNLSPKNIDNGVYEVTFTPLVASYQFSQSDHIAFSLGVSGLAGNLQKGRRAIPGQGIWTLTPKVAYTRVFPSSDGGSSTILAVGSFSRKAVAGYQDGAVGRIEMLVMKQNVSGWGYGGVAAAIEQLKQDPSSLIGRTSNLTSNEGIALGIGPQISWRTRWQGTNIELQYRWLYEFRTPTGHAGQPMLLSATIHL